MRSLIINYSKIIIENLIKNMKSSYVSIMIDGAKRWKHRYISIIIYTRYEYVYYETRQVYRENAEAISNFLNDCMHYLDSHGKKLCSICSDDYTANIKACKFKNWIIKYTVSIVTAIVLRWPLAINFQLLVKTVFSQNKLN